MNNRDFIYALACLSFAVVIGGAVYEHLAVVPRWTMAPPASLSMFQGEYGLNPTAFWKPIHPITLLLFATSLVLSWKWKRRKNILIATIGYVIVLVVTFAFFVPELIALTTTAYSQTIDIGLVKRAKLWEMLSLVRLTVLIMLSLVLFLGMTKNEERHLL
ncbi:hypothetical protein [Flavobacterium sp.]|uniref:hypothetical protein n=1 Tax=Flavobacterium sp. TaxID=239 RepID=UPI0039E72A7A